MRKVLAANDALLDKIAGGKAVKGTFVVTGEPTIVEILGYGGFDFVIIDTEHSPNGLETVQTLARTAEVAGLAALVRVTHNDPGLILKALDAGAGGVVVPQVNTAEQARAAVKAARYAPLGDRGIAGIVRAARYGFIPMDEYIAATNRKAQVIIQIEHLDAVKNLDEILMVEGLDGVFIGPTDLSQSMGLTGQFNHPEVRRTISEILKKVRASDKYAGIFCLGADDAREWHDQGALLLAVLTDTMLFSQAVKNMMKEMKNI